MAHYIDKINQPKLSFLCQTYSKATNRIFAILDNFIVKNKIRKGERLINFEVMDEYIRLEFENDECESNFDCIDLNDFSYHVNCSVLIQD